MSRRQYQADWAEHDHELRSVGNIDHQDREILLTSTLHYRYEDYRLLTDFVLMFTIYMYDSAAWSLYIAKPRSQGKTSFSMKMYTKF